LQGGHVWIFPFTSLQSEPGGAPKFLSAKRYQDCFFLGTVGQNEKIKTLL
jgi:hypothetical protein